jgi:hypothetical protein
MENEDVLKQLLMKGLQAELIKNNIKSSGELDHFYINPESNEALKTYEQSAQLALDMFDEEERKFLSGN